MCYGLTAFQNLNLEVNRLNYMGYYKEKEFEIQKILEEVMAGQIQLKFESALPPGSFHRTTADR